jgi:hypothetical protein
MNSIGSAVSPRDAPFGLLNQREMQPSLTTRNIDKKVKFSFGKRSVSIDPSIANKIGRPINSLAYETFANQEQPINVLSHIDSTNLV